MKTAFSKKTRPDPELLALKAELLEAQGELALAYRRFDQAVDPELVESCVYQISAAKARCNYLIRTIKERDPHAIAAVSGRAPAEVQKKNGENLFTDEENTEKPAGRDSKRNGFGGERTNNETKRNHPGAYRACEDEGDTVWT